MRKRKHEIKIRLTDKEIDHLNKLVLESKLPRESYLRMLISGLVPRAAPSKELYDTIILLRGISSDIHTIAMNDRNYEKYQKDYQLLEDEISKIMILMRQPTNLEELWQSQKYGQ